MLAVGAGVEEAKPVYGLLELDWHSLLRGKDVIYAKVVVCGWEGER